MVAPSFILLPVILSGVGYLVTSLKDTACVFLVSGILIIGLARWLSAYAKSSLSSLLSASGVAAMDFKIVIRGNVGILVVARIMRRMCCDAGCLFRWCEWRWCKLSCCSTC